MPLQVDIITAFPEWLTHHFQYSIPKIAQQKKHVQVNVHNLRDYTTCKHKKIDDYAYGGTPGMVLMIEPIARCMDALKKNTSYDAIIYMAPDGALLTQPMVNQWSLAQNLMVLCGHYKGIDERVRMHLITHEISIGNYVLSGGELAAAVFTDAIIRLLPGVLSDANAALTDSFQDQMVAPPVYTRPAQYHNWAVPAILRSGHAKAIQQWEHDQAMRRTQERRPALYQRLNP